MSLLLATKLVKVLYSLDDKIDLGLRNIKNLVTYQLETLKRGTSGQTKYSSAYDSSLAAMIIKTPIAEAQPSKHGIQEYDEEYEETLVY